METPEHLIVDLGRIDHDEPEVLTGHLAQELLELDDLEQLHPAGDISYNLTCQIFAENELLVRGTIKLPCNCICSRCGCDYEQTFVESMFCETFEVQGLETLDLTESVREGIILALPSYPICKEDCKGICLRCGQDLNAGPCMCDQANENSPWDALNGLMPEA